jgi:hypothetical protein
MMCMIRFDLMNYRQRAMRKINGKKNLLNL